MGQRQDTKSRARRGGRGAARQGRSEKGWRAFCFVSSLCEKQKCFSGGQMCQCVGCGNGSCLHLAPGSFLPCRGRPGWGFACPEAEPVLTAALWALLHGHPAVRPDPSPRGLGLPCSIPSPLPNLHHLGKFQQLGHKNKIDREELGKCHRQKMG